MNLEEKYLDEAVIQKHFKETQKLYDEKWRLIKKFEDDLDDTKIKYSIAMEKAFKEELKLLLPKVVVDKQLLENLLNEVENFFEEDARDMQYDLQDYVEKEVKKLK